MITLKYTCLYILIIPLVFCCKTNNSNSSSKPIKNMNISETEQNPARDGIKHNGRYDLISAIGNGDLNLVIHILTNKPEKINQRITSLEETPLMIACHFSEYEIIEYLIENGASVNVSDTDGMTPLLLSLEFFDFDSKISKDIVLLFIDNNAGFTALSLAIERGNEDITQLLIDNGAVELNRCSRGGLVPL